MSSLLVAAEAAVPHLMEVEAAPVALFMNLITA
jgi:hypothetical protein